MDPLTKLNRYIAHGKVYVFSKSYCPYCVKAKDFLKKNEIKYLSIEVDSEPELETDDEFLDFLENHSKIDTYPKIYIGLNCIGGYTDMYKLFQQNLLFQMLEKEGISFKDTSKF